MSLTAHLWLYGLAFILIWIGSGLVVSTVMHLAHSWRLSPFTVSFFLLGIMTSLPEITISSIAVLDHTPLIFAGTLLGGTMLLLLGIIPLLGIITNGISLPTQLDRRQLLLTLVVILAPALMFADQRLTRWEGALFIILYGCLVLFVNHRQSFMEKVTSSLKHRPKHFLLLLAKALIGIGLLVWSGNQIVNNTLYLAEVWHIPPFFLSLFLVTLGSNLPELSIIVRAMWQRQREIAFADYLGSAASNTLLSGIFVLWHGQTVVLPGLFLQRFIFLGIGLVLFYLFAQTRHKLSRKECLALLLLYFAFVAFELLTLEYLN